MALRLFNLILFSTILSSTILAQFDWVNPYPTPYRLKGIYFVDSLYAWSVGYNSIIIKTTDGGVTWIEQNIPFRAILRNVYFADRNRGWIISGDEKVPSGGALLYTTDGGDNWTPGIPFSQNNGFNDMCFVTPLIGYVGGFTGVKKTTDGGITWTNAGGTRWTTTVFFIDSLIGWFGNTVGGIYKTNDGGNSWNLVEDIKFHWHKKIKFVSPMTGWIVSEGLYSNYSTIYKTTDGGESWFLQDSLANRSYQNLEIRDSLNVWVVGENGLVLYTTDGGQMWLNSVTNNSDDYFDISFQGKKKWIVGGGHYPIIFFSRETGFPWELRSKNLTKLDMSEIVFADDRIGWFVGSNGEVFKTIDSGMHWNKINLFSIDFTSVSVPSQNVVYMAGATGEFVKSLDGGNSWSVSQIQSPYGSHKIKFFSETNGYSFNTDLGRLIKTTDAGNTWTELGNYFNGFFFADSLNGWTYLNPIEYYNSYLYHTTDGGLTWSDTTKVNGLIQTMYFLNEDIGWYSGYDTLYYTQDAGRSWNIINSSIGFFITQMIFVSEDEGFLLGESSDLISIYHTTDGGLTFSPLKKYTELTYLNFSNSNYAWSVGNYGQVLKIDRSMVRIENTPFPSVMESIHLEQNFPNPFNPNTTIRYSIPYNRVVSLKVYDILGREVVTLVNKRQAVGTYEIMFDGNKLSSGLYFYRLKAGNSVQTKKFILMK